MSGNSADFYIKIIPLKNSTIPYKKGMGYIALSLGAACLDRRLLPLFVCLPCHRQLCGLCENDEEMAEKVQRNSLS